MKKYAILGHPVDHSLSPKLHNAVFQELGLIDREYVYCDTPPEDLAQVMSECRDGKYEGFSVTIPHKEAVISYLDEVTGRAKKVGAVNTILRIVKTQNSKSKTKSKFLKKLLPTTNYQLSTAEGKVRLVGDNTDYLGFRQSLIEVGIVAPLTPNPLKGEKHLPTLKKSLVLGSGGVARAVIAVLTDLGCKVEVAALNPRKEKQLFHDFKVVIKGYEELDPEDDYDLIVNCTPVGMMKKEDKESQEDQEDLLLKDSKWYKPERVYADVIYTPRITPFLNKSQDVGAKIVTGDRLFIWQAVEQAKYFCEKDEAPMALMEEILESDN